MLIDRLLDLTLADLHENLALDEALLIEAEERGTGGILRLWEPQSEAVVLGASGRLLEDVDVEACRAEGVTIGRRSSGGGTVVIGPGSLNATVVLPVDAAPGLGAVDTAQAFVLSRIAEAIARRGPAVEVLGLGDLTIGGRKFSGCAQRRLRGHFLVHLSILHAFDLERITRLTRLPRRQPAYRAGRSHDDFLMNLPLSREGLREALVEAWNADEASVGDSEYPEALVRELAKTKFADPAWIERL